jgi:Family of unknown function (DUF5939)
VGAHSAQFLDVKGEPTRERQTLTVVFNKVSAPHHVEYRRNRPASSLADSAPSKPTPESVAARLDVDERLLLFCIASGTDSGILSLADGGCGVAAGGDSGESRNRASELLAR